MSILFTPAKIGNIEVNNRFVRSATAGCFATEEGKVSERYLNLYTNLARGGIGLIITGNFIIQQNGKALPRAIMIDNDEVIVGLKKLTDEVHKHGAKIVAQINHLGRHANPKISGERQIAPSSVRTIIPVFSKPREMTEMDIKKVIEAFGLAAWRVKEAGFDGVQFHCAHGYLIHQFLSRHTNRRRDRWGGSLEYRMRFLIEVYNFAREKVGPEYPILVKINSKDMFINGLTIEDSVKICKRLNELGVAAIEVSGGVQDTGGLEITRGDFPVDIVLRGRNVLEKTLIRLKAKSIKEEAKFKENYFLPEARRIKHAVNIPVIVVGGIRDVKKMEQIIENGDADFVSMSRPFIRQPNLIRLIEQGKTNPVTCTSCNKCTLEVVTQGKPLRCYK